MTRKNTIFASIILVFASLQYYEHSRQHASHKFRSDDRQPNAVYVKENGQDHDRRYLEHESTQKRDDCRRKTVVERCEEAGAEDGVAHEQKGQREDAEAGDCEIEKLLVVADEDLRKRRRKRFCGDDHDNAEATDHDKAFLE